MKKSAYQNYTNNNNNNNNANVRPNTADSVYGGIDFTSLEKDLRDNFDRFKSSEKKDIVLVIGPTRSGKGTLINYMLGYNLVKKRNNLSMVYEVEKSRKDTQAVSGNRNVHICYDQTGSVIADIDHGAASATLFTQTFVTSNAGREICFCDTPGFEDNGNNESRILSSLSLEYAIKAASSISSIVVVINLKELSVQGGILYTKLAIIIGKIIKDNDLVKDSLVIVFSHADQDQKNGNPAAKEHIDFTDGLCNQLDEVSQVVKNAVGNDTSKAINAHLVEKATELFKYVIGKRRYLIQYSFEDDNDRKLLFGLINNINRPVPKDNFNFLESNDTRVLMNTYINVILEEAKGNKNLIDTYNNSLSQYDREKTELTKEMDKAKTKFEEIENKLGQITPVTPVQDNTAEQIKNCEADKTKAIEHKNIEETNKKTKEKEIEDLNSKYDSLNSDVLVDYEDGKISEVITNGYLSYLHGLGWKLKELHYTGGVPFADKVTEECYVDGKLDTERQFGNFVNKDPIMFSPANGIYRKEYQTARNYRAGWEYKIEVKFQVKKKNLPANVEEMKRLNKLIAVKNQELIVITNKISELEKSITDIPKQIALLERRPDRNSVNYNKELLETQKSLHEMIFKQKEKDITSKNTLKSQVYNKQTALRGEILLNIQLFDTFIKLRQVNISFPKDTEQALDDFMKTIYPVLKNFANQNIQNPAPSTSDTNEYSEDQINNAGGSNSNQRKKNTK